MEAIAKTAFLLAERFDAQIEGLYAYTPPNEQIQIYYDAAGPVYHESLLKDAEARTDAAKKRAREIFNKLAKPHSGVTSKFVTMTNGTMAGVAERARVSDLTVIGTEPVDNAALWMDIRDAAIFQSGRPVIVAPSKEVSAGVGKTVVIGWKGSVEAARAVFAAGPFLAAAKSVHLISVGNDAVAKQKLNEVQAYLSLHATDVNARIIGSGKSNSEELLLEEAGKYPDAMLVMGAYSQWRWKEWVFGGVTEYVLGKTTLPVLMAH